MIYSIAAFGAHITASILLIALAGCSTGVPSFVKYTDDSKYVIFSDERFVRSYFYQVPSGKIVAFDASFAHEDTHRRRWILQPAPLAVDQRLMLLSIEPDGALAVRILPELPLVDGPRAVRAALGPGENQIRVVLCRENFRDPKWRAFRLDIGQEHWQEVVSEPERTDLRGCLENHLNDSIAILGYVPPSDYSFKMLGGPGEKGKNVRCITYTSDWLTRREEYRLPSPDGRTFVTIRFSRPRAIWGTASGEVRLTDLASGSTRVLIGNTAVVAQVFQNYVYGPCAFVILLVAHPNF